MERQHVAFALAPWCLTSWRCHLRDLDVTLPAQVLTGARMLVGE